MNATALPVTSGFDYDCVAIEIAASLRQQAGRIRDKVGKTTATIIDIGRELTAVKSALDHGQFGHWVETECGFTLRTAENYIRLALFSEGKSETVSHLPPATAYRLASKNVSPEVVDAVLTRISAGVVVSDRDMGAALDDDRDNQKEKRKREQAALRRQNPRLRKRDDRFAAARAREQKLECERREAAGIVAGEIFAAIGADGARLIVKALNETNPFLILTALKEILGGEATEGGANG